MSEQIPLYLGIPLAILCVSVMLLVIVFAIGVWKDR